MRFRKCEEYPGGLVDYLYVARYLHTYNLSMMYFTNISIILCGQLFPLVASFVATCHYSSSFTQLNTSM